MSEYAPFLVIGSFGVVLFLGTIFWTEYLFPEKKDRYQPKQTEFMFNKTSEQSVQLISSHR